MTEFVLRDKGIFLDDVFSLVYSPGSPGHAGLPGWVPARSGLGQKSETQGIPSSPGSPGCITNVSQKTSSVSYYFGWSADVQIPHQPKTWALSRGYDVLQHPKSVFGRRKCIIKHALGKINSILCTKNLILYLFKLIRVG